MITDVAQTEDAAGRLGVHEDCIVCGRCHAGGLRLQYRQGDDGAVEAEFNCDRAYQGYSGAVHGGVISAVLDGAMTHCMFTRGLTGMTAELKVRYRRPVRTDRPATVRGWMEHSYPPLYYMEAELVQDGKQVAKAQAKFMDQPQLAAKG